MPKLTGQTPDIAQENIERLKTIFPDVFEEGKIDFDKLKQDLGEYLDDAKERYNFTWNGKGRALRLAQTPSTGTLRPAPMKAGIGIPRRTCILRATIWKCLSCCKKATTAR